MITHTKKEILDILKYHPYLISFLQKKKIFFKFVSYCMNPKWENPNKDYITSNKYYPNIFGSCFLFNKTEEGHLYWDRLWSEYTAYLRKNREL